MERIGPFLLQQSRHDNQRHSFRCRLYFNILMSPSIFFAFGFLVSLKTKNGRSSHSSCLFALCVHTTETEVHILWQSVVSLCGCPRELCYPLNSINHLLSLERISFTACLCPHQTVMMYSVDCKALAFTVVVHDSVDAFDELSISH